MAKLNIDGTQIAYGIRSAADYYQQIEGYSPSQVDNMIDNHYEEYQLVGQIIGLKISCFLLRHTTHVCESLADSLIALKKELIKQLYEKYHYIFKEAEMEKSAATKGVVEGSNT